MKVHQAFWYEIKPHLQQDILLAKPADSARFAYNWGLAKRIKLFDSNEGNTRFTGNTKQRQILNSLKHSDYPWIRKVSKCNHQEVLRKLEVAFKELQKSQPANCQIGLSQINHKRFTRIRVLSESVPLVRTKEATGHLTGCIISGTVDEMLVYKLRQRSYKY